MQEIKDYGKSGSKKPPKDTNKIPITDPKEMYICELSEKISK